MLQNKMLKLTHEMRSQFQKHFGVALSPPIFDGIFGLDVIALDDMLKTPDGKSTEDWIRETKGEDALKLVWRLINL